MRGTSKPKMRKEKTRLAMKHGPRELCRWLVAHGKKGNRPAGIVRLRRRDFWRAAAVGGAVTCCQKLV